MLGNTALKKWETIIVLIFSFLIVLTGCFDNKNKEENTVISTDELVKSVFKRGQQHCSLDFYAGTLMLHGMSEFTLLNGSNCHLDSVVSLFQKFGNGEIRAKGNFTTYEAGGTGAAYLSWQNATTELDQQVYAAAEKMMRTQKRTHDNIMTAPNLTHEMFIDVVFTVTPFLLYSGLKFDKPEWVDYAVFQTLETFRILRDESTGLVHQGRGFQGEGVVSADCWSRGNGWGAFALAILARDLPESHPKRKEVEALVEQFFTSVLNHQDKNGLWHQEMTAPESYIETSGSGLLLYGLGLVLEKGLLPKKYFKNFETGIRNLTSYVGSDGSVSHCCFSCRCPGNGTKEDYIKHPWVYNDHHAFGPVILAFTQAEKIGYNQIVPAEKLGKYTIADSPEGPRTYVREARGRDVAWENDRIAFRVFGSEVRAKVGSGVDIWAKSVEYPILDKWYALNEKGEDYHVDRGEGCDFYNMGKRAGCGGIALWKNNKPYYPETFDRFRITRNQNDSIEFELSYNTWEVPGDSLTLTQRVQMGNGTNRFKVTGIIHSNESKELTIAVGLSTIENASVHKDKKNGILSVWEAFENHGNLGTAVLIDAEKLIGFEEYEGDVFALMNVKTNTPFSYFAVAGWDKGGTVKNGKEWGDYLIREANAK